MQLYQGEKESVTSMHEYLRRGVSRVSTDTGPQGSQADMAHTTLSIEKGDTLHENLHTHPSGLQQQEGVKGQLVPSHTRLLFRLFRHLSPQNITTLSTNFTLIDLHGLLPIYFITL